MSREAFAWPEATFYFGSAGEAPAARAYVQNMYLEVAFDWKRYHNLSTGAWAARSTFVLSDKRVSIGWSELWSDSTALLRANSGSAWNFAISASAFGQTGAVQVWSAVFKQFRLEGQENGLFRVQGQIEALDYSAV